MEIIDPDLPLKLYDYFDMIGERALADGLLYSQ